jgi:hypothetical protein
MPPYTHHRARVAALRRYRAPHDSEVVSERQLLAEEKLVNAVERALAKAPPLSDEVRSRIIGLLGGAE